jgi:hypothetical protein
MAVNFDIDGTGDILLDAFKDRIRARLRVEVLAIVKDEIDKAIEAAVGALEIAIQTHTDHMRNQLVAKVIVEDKREKAK